MKIAGITDAKKRLTAMVLKAAQTFSSLIAFDLRRGASQWLGAKDEQDGRIARLVRERILRSHKPSYRSRRLRRRLPRMKSGTSAAAVLIGERQDGR